MKNFLKITCVLLAMTVSSRAADFDVRIVNLDGTPLTAEKGKEVELTVRTTAIEGLMTPYPDEQNVTIEEKMRREDLARKILAKDTDKITSEDIALIKRLINKRYPSPLIVGQAARALEKK